MNIDLPRSLARAAAGAALAAALCAPSLAAPAIDARRDFLPTYTGPHDTDLDARVADVRIDARAGTVTLFAIMAGPIDRASGKFFVFGIDRGRGEVGRDLVFQGPLGGTPAIGAHVRWDAAVGILANGDAVFFDALDPAVVPLHDVRVHIEGSEITATVPLSLFPSQGLDVDDYTFNFWPRSQLSLANTTVSDFLPDDGDSRVSVARRRRY